MSLALTSATSMMSKGISEIESVVYYNTILLSISIALLSATITLSLGCSGLEGIQSVYYKAILLVFTIANFSLLIAMVSNKQFSTCPSNVKGMVIANLVINGFIVIIGLVYAFYHSSKVPLK